MTIRELTAIAILWRNATTRARRAAVEKMPELDVLWTPETGTGLVFVFPRLSDKENAT